MDFLGYQQILGWISTTVYPCPARKFRSDPLGYDSWFNEETIPETVPQQLSVANLDLIRLLRSLYFVVFEYGSN